MAKSMRSKREKRLRAIRREIVEPIYEKKEAAKLVAQEAALNAPKLPVRPTKSKNDDIATAAMELITNAAANRADAAAADMDIEMADGKQSMRSLKPLGKKMKKKIKIAKRKGHGKGKIRRKHNV